MEREEKDKSKNGNEMENGKKNERENRQRMRRVRIGLRMNGKGNVDETNLESFLSSSTSILEGGGILLRSVPRVIGAS